MSRRTLKMASRLATCFMLIGVSFVVDSLPTNLAAATSSGLATSSASAWSAPTLFNTILTSVSCPSANFCVAVSLDGDFVTYNGTSWSAPKLVHYSSVHGHGLGSVSCASANFCVALGEENGVALTYNGTSWSAPKEVDLDGNLGSVSCASANFCVAEESENGDVVTYNGTSWSAPKAIFPDGFSGGASISCPTANFCVALGWLGGYVVTYNGKSWSAAKEVFTNGGESVSCPSANFCVAVGGNGDFVTYNGTSWSTPTLIPDKSPANLNLDSISCASAHFCATVSESLNGDAITYDGTSWSTPTYYANTEWTKVSCPSANFCVGVGTWLGTAVGGAVGGALISYHGSTCTPTISSVSSFRLERDQTVTIKGSCFGESSSLIHVASHDLEIVDSRFWSACSDRPPSPSSVTCRITSWTNKKITFAGFAGTYGSGSDEHQLEAGDGVGVEVWNAKTGTGPAIHRDEVNVLATLSTTPGYQQGVAMAKKLTLILPSTLCDAWLACAKQDSNYPPTYISGQIPEYVPEEKLPQLWRLASEPDFATGLLNSLSAGTLYLFSTDRYVSLKDKLYDSAYSTGAVEPQVTQALYTDDLNVTPSEGSSLISGATSSDCSATPHDCFTGPGIMSNELSTTDFISGLDPAQITHLGVLSTNYPKEFGPFEGVAKGVVNDNWQGYANYNGYLGSLSPSQLAAIMSAATSDHQLGIVTVGLSAQHWFELHGGKPVSADPLDVAEWVTQLSNMLGADAAPSGVYYAGVGQELDLASHIVKVAGALVVLAVVTVISDGVIDAALIVPLEGWLDAADIAELGSVVGPTLEASDAVEESLQALSTVQSIGTANAEALQGIRLIKSAKTIYQFTDKIATAKDVLGDLFASVPSTSLKLQLQLYDIIMNATLNYALFSLLEDGYLVHHDQVVTPAGASFPSTWTQITDISANLNNYLIKVPGDPSSKTFQTPASVVWATIYSQFINSLSK